MKPKQENTAQPESKLSTPDAAPVTREQLLAAVGHAQLVLEEAQRTSNSARQRLIEFLNQPAPAPSGTP